MVRIWLGILLLRVFLVHVAALLILLATKDALGNIGLLALEVAQGCWFLVFAEGVHRYFAGAVLYVLLDLVEELGAFLRKVLPVLWIARVTPS